MNNGISKIAYKNPALRPTTADLLAYTEEEFEEHNISTIYEDAITHEDAEYIHHKLVEAEKEAKAKGEVSPLKRVGTKDIMTRARNGHILLRDKQSNKIIGCIFLYKYDQSYKGNDTYERVTLWKDKVFWQGYSDSIKAEKKSPETASLKSLNMGKYLMWKITRMVGNKPLLSVTDSPAVVENNLEMNYYILCRKHLPPVFKQLLSEYKTLSDKNYSDKFFCLNPALYELVCQEIKELYGEEKFSTMESMRKDEVNDALTWAKKAQEDSQKRNTHISTTKGNLVGAL